MTEAERVTCDEAVLDKWLLSKYPYRQAVAKSAREFKKKMGFLPFTFMHWSLSNDLPAFDRPCKLSMAID